MLCRINLALAANKLHRCANAKYVIFTGRLNCGHRALQVFTVPAQHY
jgi:hypothetical protein